MGEASAVPATAPLRQQEAVLLAHALVARVAEQVGARVLFIKGPTAVAVGARPSRPSSDVDVLVDPAAFDALCRALADRGWQNRSAGAQAHTHIDDIGFAHSDHYIHPQWPCDIDVHYNFAGFLAPAADVFEALWTQRVMVRIAGVDLPSCGLLGHILVVALHALRDPQKSKSIADLEHLEREAAGRLHDGAIDELSELARRTGCEATAAPVLRRLGARVPPPNPAYLRAAQGWVFHQQASGTAGVMWMAELLRAPWSDRATVLARAVLPPRSLLLSSHLTADVSRVTVARLHLRRWWRGLGALPRAVRILGRLRR